MPLPSRPQQALPGLEAALDESVMRGHLQAALFGAGSRWTLDRAEPDRPLFAGDDSCTVKYECRVRDAADGELYAPIVVGRLFPDGARCAAYLLQKLAPLAERVRKRSDLAMFASPAAVIEPLHMVVHLWPLDGELPNLVEATDPRHMAGVITAALARRFNLEACRVDVVRHRRGRCVLRYTVTGRASGSAEAEQRVLYGKLMPRGEPFDGATLARLRTHFEARRDGERLTIPRLLGWRPELGLALLEAVPGEAKVGTALRARLEARPPGEGASLEEMLSRCVRAATALHGSGLRLGPELTLGSRLADLEAEVETTRLFSPEFADRAAAWLGRVSERARAIEAERHRLCHGEFTPAQVLFDGERLGLVDLDHVCQAETALDLGQFLAHLRTQARKSSRAESVSPTFETELCDRFLDEYASAMSIGAEDLGRLRARATLYEVAILLRLALHSAQRFKPARLDSAGALVEERLGALD